MDIRAYSVNTEYQAVCEVNSNHWTSKLFDTRVEAEAALRSHILNAHAGHIREVNISAFRAIIITSDSDGTTVPGVATVELPGDIGSLEFTPKEP